jgi:hypothetical protein
MTHLAGTPGFRCTPHTFKPNRRVTVTFQETARIRVCVDTQHTHAIESVALLRCGVSRVLDETALAGKAAALLGNRHVLASAERDDVCGCASRHKKESAYWSEVSIFSHRDFSEALVSHAPKSAYPQLVPS